MITEDYVSFETAKLLKEKGFAEECNSYFISDDEIALISVRRDFNDYGVYLSAPTLQMTMKWLREVHGLFVSIGNDDLDYNWQIFDVKNRTKDLDPTCLTDSYAGYRKYELAAEAAIIYCLENLILRIMATIRACTTIEQSRKLAEILPIESADMCYVSKDDRGIEFFEEPDVIDGTLEDVDIRCWSLAALFGVLPDGTNIIKDKADTENEKYMCVAESKDDIISMFGNNPVDACVAMIEKLYELKML